jgi:ABC-type amino acid transport system permease subunit
VQEPLSVKKYAELPYAERMEHNAIQTRKAAVFIARVIAIGIVISFIIGIIIAAKTVRHGRPVRLLLRAIIAAVLSLLVLRLVPGQPSGPAVVTGLITWFVLSARGGSGPATGPVTKMMPPAGPPAR